MPLLGTLQVLQDPGQLHARLPLLADSPEFPLHSPGERKIGLKPTGFPSRAPPPSMTSAAPLLCNSTRQGYNGGIQTGSAAQASRQGKKGSPANHGSPSLLPEPRGPLDGPSLGILALFIKHHNLIHAEDGAGSSNLAGQVGAKLGRLGVVQDGARKGHAQGVVPPWAGQGCSWSAREARAIPPLPCSNPRAQS